MVQLSEKANHQVKEMDLPMLLDPTVLRAARRIYRTYCVLHSKANKRPFGVAIHKESHRGQLIFNTRPILLPGESFVPLKQLEAELY